MIVGAAKNKIAGMKIGLTKYGLPQVVVFPVVLLIVMAACLFAGLPGWAVAVIEAVLGIVLLWVLSFFRDPYRVAPNEKNILLSPADGTITDIETVEEKDFIAGQSIRIGIFLSIFNVHINRSPCDVEVKKITYKPGQYKNAMNAQSGRVNESNDLWLLRTQAPNDKLIVRQISGAIARRIVCKTAEKQKLAAGEKFGMIKFGSRTELYLPASGKAHVLVKKGDKVKAGGTTLVRYE